MTKEKRRGTIFWRQHATHKTTVVPFSLRARERPTVTVSLKWSEVAASSTASPTATTCSWRPIRYSTRCPNGQARRTPW